MLTREFTNTNQNEYFNLLLIFSLHFIPMLTFEKIRELERREREEKGLQKLPDNILEELKEYLRKKEDVADQREMKNIKSTIERLFELRENKILDFALYNIRTGMPVENLTEEEKEFFKTLVEELKRFRQGVFSLLEKNTESKNKKNLFRVKKDMPAIIGPDLKEYKLSENEIIDISALPKELNELLMKKDVIEKIE